MTTVSVFGGTGFLGRRLVRRLATEGATVRVAVRHPERARRPGRCWPGSGHSRLRRRARPSLGRRRRRRGRGRRQRSLRLCREGRRDLRGRALSKVPRRSPRSRPLPVSPASCSSLASGPIPSRGRLTSARADAANERSSRRFRALPLCARAPCSVPATPCSARSPTSPGCFRCCH